MSDPPLKGGNQLFLERRGLDRLLQGLPTEMTTVTVSFGWLVGQSVGLSVCNSAGAQYQCVVSIENLGHMSLK